MKNRSRIILIICLALLFPALWNKQLRAQDEEEWSPPFRMSTDKRRASEATLVTDSYGYVHMFWTEVLEDDSSLIMYARFDGRIWSTPVDIYVASASSPVGNISAVVSADGILHIMWVEGLIGRIHYKSAPAHEALSVHSWQRTRRVQGVLASRVQLQIDSKGTMHMLFSQFIGQDPGLYYGNSLDDGETWSDFIWLDPDILPGFGPRSLNFIVDEEDGLHAAWYYVPQEAIGGDWVRYTHSFDGGVSWSQPLTIDRLEETDSPDKESLSAASPVMAVVGQSVHIIWAGGELHYRHHRFSMDRGITWTEDRRIFGELNGQAFDGLAVDGNGRLHYFGQIRFPMGIYHAIWDGEEWSDPSLIYFIRYDSDDPVGGKIQAHNTHPIVRVGNDLLLTFTDPPPELERRLFVMEYKLENIAPLPVMSIPTPTPTPTPNASPTPMPTEAVVIPSFAGMPPPSSVSSSGSALWLGIISTLFLSVSTIAFKLIRLKR